MMKGGRNLENFFYRGGGRKGGERSAPALIVKTIGVACGGGEKGRGEELSPSPAAKREKGRGFNLDS